MPRRSDQDAELAELYGQIPDIPDCKGHCWISCGPIDMGGRERQRLRDAGFQITPREQAQAQRGTYWCEALGPDGLCQAYDRRPVVCRIWGTCPALACPYGCRPERWLSDMQAMRLLAAAHEVGGGAIEHEVSTRELPAWLEARLAAFIREHNTGDEIRVRHYRELPPEVTRRRARK